VSNRGRSVSLIVVLLGLLCSPPALAQPIPPGGEVPPPTQPPPVQTREQAIEQLRQAIEQLRNASQVVGQEVQALEAQLQAASQLPEGAGAPATPPASADIAQLRQEIAALRTEMEEMRTETTEQNEAVLRDLERRVVFSGIMATYLGLPQHNYAYLRAVKAILLWNAQISPRLRFYGELEFEDAAGVGDGEGHIVLEQGYGELILATQLGLRIGVLLVPFGEFNRRHEAWRHPFFTRPMTNFLIFPSTYSDTGLELFGTLARSEKFQFGYELAIVNGLDDEIITPFGGPGFRNARPSYATDNNGGKSVVGRLGLAIGEHVQLGASGYWGQYTDHDVRPKAELGMIGFDAQLVFRRLTVRFEAIHMQLEEGFTPVDDDDDPETPDVDAEFPRAAQGVSGEVEASFWPAFLADSPLGDFEDPVLFAAARVDFGRIEFRSSADPRQVVLTGVFGYRPIPRSALRFEFAQGIKSENNPGLTNRGWGGEDWLASLSFALGY